jgi:O-antigen ligase
LEESPHITNSGFLIVATIFLYLTALFIAPQLWVEPFVGLRVDLFIYPLLALTVIFSSKRNPLALTPQDGFFLLMVLWIVISAVLNGFSDRSSEIITNYIKWFLLYKLVASVVSSSDRLRWVCLMIVGFALVLAVEGIAHRFSPDGLGWAGQTLGWIDPDAMAAGEKGRTRWINIFDGPGVFCVVYTIALPFLMQYLFSPFSIATRLLNTGLVGLLLTAIFFTGSRGGFLTTLGLFALFVALRFRISVTKIALASVVIMTAYAFAPSHLTTMNDQSKSASHRVEMWAEGVEMVQQNPVFGIGKGNFLAYTGKLIAHNSAVEVMGETGFVGLILWLGCFYMGLKNIASYLSEEKNEVHRSYVIALALSLIGYAISSMFVTLEYETLYFLFGLTAAVGHRVSIPVRFTKRDFWMLLGIGGVWVIGLKLFVMIFFA